MSEAGWEPILDGALADAARTAIREIGAALASRTIEPGDAGGVALFWTYAASTDDDPDVAAHHAAAMDRLTDVIEAGHGSLALYGGLAGDSWVLAHAGSGVDEFLAQVDERLCEALIEPTRGDYDLIGGVTGLGVYLVERLIGEPGSERARAGIGHVVDRLVAASERTDAGTTWHTPVHRVPAPQRAALPAGYYNCGASHGVPGVIALLGHVVELPDPPPAARGLVEDAIRWLLAQRTDGGFPSWVAPGRPGVPTRTAWCYGDPGVAATLWNGAVRAGLPTEPAIACARSVIARPPDATGVVDAELCHGAAGLAHIYNRFYQASGEPGFRDAARAWFERALALRTPGEGLAGFRTFANHTGQWVGDPGFLEGIAGIGLALIGAVSAIDPDWDRLLMTDVPVAARGPAA